jgi:hypothetical protein
LEMVCNTGSSEGKLHFTYMHIMSYYCLLHLRVVNVKVIWYPAPQGSCPGPRACSICILRYPAWYCKQ